MDQFSGVKIFSATMQRDRDALGDVVTRWLDERRAYARKHNTSFEVVDHVVSQSSDQAFHCLSIVLFVNEGERS